MLLLGAVVLRVIVAANVVRLKKNLTTLKVMTNDFLTTLCGKKNIIADKYGNKKNSINEN